MIIVTVGRLTLAAVAASFVAGCSVPGRDDVASSDDPLITDADSMTRRSDGRFDVHCRNGRIEVATAAEIQSGDICKPLDGPSFTGPDDPLNPGSCSGRAWALADIDGRLPPGSLKGDLAATAAYQVVTRSCSLRLTGTPSCTPWSETPEEARFAKVVLELIASPSTQNATASLRLENTAKYSVNSYSCENETGDLCPINHQTETVEFGIVGGTTVSTSGSSPFEVSAYAGAISPDPIALMRSSSQWGHRESDGTFWWGSLSWYPTTRDWSEQVQSLISRHVPSTDSGTTLDSTAFTPTCARIQFRSAPPAVGATSWTESITAILARY